MRGSSLLAYAKELCRQLDEGLDLPRLRRVAAVVAIPAALLTASCDVPGMLYGAPPSIPNHGEETNCFDGVDNNSDGWIDCEDVACAEFERCLGCGDGLDNDGDERADCTDDSCQGSEFCLGGCATDEDLDGNGLTGCDDPSCDGSDPCL